MAGIKEIAKITGLSLATISRVFNKGELVSEKTRKKVLKAAQEIEYRPNKIASALRSGRSKIIGVIVPEINNHFFSSIINGIEQQLKNSGYNLIIAQSHESRSNEKAALESFIQLNVDGVLISVSNETTNMTFLEKRTAKFPIIYFDRLPGFKHENVVVFDDFKGARIATQYLIDKGCKQLVHIQGNQNVSIFRNRKKGFEDALRKNNFEILEEKSLEFCGDIEKDTILIKNTIARYPDTDGFFCHGDESCLHAINILKTLHISIPKEIQLIGFGNTEFSSLTNPKISTIDQKCKEMGIQSADLLLKKLNQKKKPNRKVILEPALIIRESTQ